MNLNTRFSAIVLDEGADHQFARLLELVCEECHVQPDAIHGTRGDPDAVMARQLVCYLAKIVLWRSSRSISNAINRKASAVNYSIRTVKKVVSVDKKIAGQVERLMLKLTNPEAPESQRLCEKQLLNYIDDLLPRLLEFKRKLQGENPQQ
jgi:hypothetical protein